jgi:hypothetical protein
MSHFHALVDRGQLSFIRLNPIGSNSFHWQQARTNFSSGETELAVSTFYHDWHRQKVLLSCGLALALHARASANFEDRVSPAR